VALGPPGARDLPVGDVADERMVEDVFALATVAGMFPLALAIGAGSQMLQPLAIAVIGGLLSSMVLSLVFTPAIHYYLGGRGKRELRTSGAPLKA